VESKKDRVNNLPTIMMVADQVSQEQQQSLRTLTYVIQHGDNIYAMIGVSILEAFNGYAPTFKASMDRFNTLKDPEKINKKPERIRIKTVQQNGTLSDALQAARVNNKRAEELATLNGMKLSDRVEKGMLIKIIE